MQPDRRFLKQDQEFWANVRAISQRVGYTNRASSQILVPSIEQIKMAFAGLSLRTDPLFDSNDFPTPTGSLLLNYFEHRADVLNNFVEPRLMEVERARLVFEEIQDKFSTYNAPIPMNKQKGDKKSPAYLTAIVNLLISHYLGGENCDFDPRSLTTLTEAGILLRTLSRRFDGAFPSTINPAVVWEIKEYYYTTTFGSRVADGIYETLLDGMELEEVKRNKNINVKHYLFIDAYYTWWTCGRSYLCRLIDMLHMGYIDEVIFGYEVVERLPIIVPEWRGLAQNRRI